MHHEHDHSSIDEAHGMPPLLTVYHAVQKERVVGIMPYTCREFERDAVLGEVEFRLFDIPFKRHLYVQFCAYSAIPSSA